MHTKTLNVNVSLAREQLNYQIHIGRDLLSEAGGIARLALGSQTRRTVVVSNRRVFDLYGARLTRSLKTNGFQVTSWLMGDGERFKSAGTAKKAVQAFSAAGLERTDAVITLGGGVVGDLAGFAAAIYLRGVPLIHVPTTITAQIDSAIGGKTGVNLAHAKNAIGSFHQPKAVIIDVETIKTLPRRELVAGWCEAVKNGAVGSRKLFDQTVMFLSQPQSSFTSPELISLIKSHCEFKAGIVTGDERENAIRTDKRSRRVLNFGHTIGHALEAATNYRRFRHGEAVGHGMRVASEISKSLGLLSASELRLLSDGIDLCGPLPPADDIDTNEILRLTQADKKKSRGNVQWVLLEAIGHPRIVADQEIPRRLIRDALRRVLTSTS
ncbi:MAG TPA: 3-dehydroquinate synthase [Pyrinomonadaceae bacterium]|nr:3-dehydroquinate synthase [Pyrinomonadaceae bacterium]